MIPSEISTCANSDAGPEPGRKHRHPTNDRKRLPGDRTPTQSGESTPSIIPPSSRPGHQMGQPNERALRHGRTERRTGPYTDTQRVATYNVARSAAHRRGTHAPRQWIRNRADPDTDCSVQAGDPICIEKGPRRIGVNLAG